MLTLLLALAAPMPDSAQIDCVAAVATVAYEQARGNTQALAFAPLGEDGARFAQVVGERLIAAGRTKEQARDAMLAAAAARQKRGAGFERADIERCVALMNTVAPPPPPPSLQQCAGLLALAVREARATAVDKDLETIAAVLDDRARTELRAQGRSGTEIDVIMATTRSEVEAEAVRRAGDAIAPGLDPAPCFELARP